MRVATGAKPFEHQKYQAPLKRGPDQMRGYQSIGAANGGGNGDASGLASGGGNQQMEGIKAGLRSARTVGTQIVVEKYEELKAMVGQNPQSSPCKPTPVTVSPPTTTLPSHPPPPPPPPLPLYLQAMAGGFTFRLLSFAGGAAMVVVSWEYTRNWCAHLPLPSLIAIPHHLERRLRYLGQRWFHEYAHQLLRSKI